MQKPHRRRSEWAEGRWGGRTRQERSQGTCAEQHRNTPGKEGLRISWISSAAVCCSSGKWHHCTTTTTGSVGVSAPDSFPPRREGALSSMGLMLTANSSLRKLWLSSYWGKTKPAPQITQIVTENKQHSSGCMLCTPEAGSLCLAMRHCLFIQPGTAPGDDPWNTNLIPQL